MLNFKFPHCWCFQFGHLTKRQNIKICISEICTTVSSHNMRMLPLILIACLSMKLWRWLPPMLLASNWENDTSFVSSRNTGLLHKLLLVVNKETNVGSRLVCGYCGGLQLCHLSIQFMYSTVLKRIPITFFLSERMYSFTNLLQKTSWMARAYARLVCINKLLKL
jgi:hypothetical protein